MSDNHQARFATMLKRLMDEANVKGIDIQTGLGLKQGYVSRWRSGDLLPQPDEAKLRKLAEMLDVPAAPLIQAAMADRAERAGVLDYYEARCRRLEEGLTEIKHNVLRTFSTLDLSEVNAFALMTQLAACVTPIYTEQ